MGMTTRTLTITDRGPSMAPRYLVVDFNDQERLFQGEWELQEFIEDEMCSPWQHWSVVYGKDSYLVVFDRDSEPASAVRCESQAVADKIATHFNATAYKPSGLE